MNTVEVSLKLKCKCSWINLYPNSFVLSQSATSTNAASTSAPAPSQATAPTSAGELFSKIVAQGETVRQLKAAKASKNEVDKAVQELLSLKVHHLF